MKELERTLVEYRPNIKYETHIQNEVDRNLFIDPLVAVNKEIPFLTHKTPVLRELETYPPAKTIEKYKHLKTEMAKLATIRDEISGSNNDIIDLPNPEPGEVIPDKVDHYIENVIDAIDGQVLFIDDQIKYFYDTDTDDDDIDKLIDKEKERLEEIQAREREELTVIADYTPSPIERAHIENLIKDRDSSIRSVDDYISYLLNERIKNGSKSVDYIQLADDVKISFLLDTEISQLLSSIQTITGIYNYRMNDVMMGETQKGLEFLVEYAGQLYPIKEISSLQYKKENRDIMTIQTNLTRYNDINFRYALFENLKKFKALRDRYKHGGLVTESIEDNEASVPFATILKNGKNTVDSQWENTFVEMLGSSQTLMKQLAAMTNSLEKQKHYSLLYRFADIVSREFDFEYKERELKTFVQRYGIDNMR